MNAAVTPDVSVTLIYERRRTEKDSDCLEQFTAVSDVRS